MKRLQSTGLRKQAEPLTLEEEELLRNKKVLGDHNPSALLNTMVGLSLLCVVVTNTNNCVTLPVRFSWLKNLVKDHTCSTRKTVSKNNPGGLKGWRVVTATLKTLSRCFVLIFKKYTPLDRPDNALYLTPLVKPSDTCLFSCVQIGRNKLPLVKQAGIQDQPFPACNSSCVFSGIDEQLVTERTGHRSMEGIRPYDPLSSTKLYQTFCSKETLLLHVIENLLLTYLMYMIISHLQILNINNPWNLMATPTMTSACRVIAFSLFCRKTIWGTDLKACWYMPHIGY